MFNKILLISLAILLSSPLFAQNDKNDSISTYYLIRHAEKDRTDSTDKDPDLNKTGLQRAENWNNFFELLKVDAIYSTNYNRTLNTVQPIAKSKNIDIIKYHPFKMDYLQFLAETNGKSVLIVGHSNTIPSFTNKIIGNEVYQDIPDTENSNLYIVTIHGNDISHVLIKMK